MIDAPVLWLFVVTCAVAVISPGPDTLLVLGNTFGGGRKNGFLTALGVCCGFFVHITATVLGLTAIVLASAALFAVVKLSGAAYLIYLGFRAWQSNGTLSVNTKNQATSLEIFTQGFFGNVLNPKVILFFMALIPQFVDTTAGNVTLQVAVFGVIDIGLSFLWYLSVILAANRIKKALAQRAGIMKWIDRMMGSLLIAIGVRLLFTRRPAT